MTNCQKAYALAVRLHQELQAQEDHHPDLRNAIALADELAREMGWAWVSER